MEAEIKGIVKTVGKAAANILFPDDIEYYAITVELVDSKGGTVEYLTFPINPEMFSYDSNSLVSIRKTMGGVTSINTSTFVPKSINMSGTFGRSFKLLLSPPTQDSGSQGIGISGQRGLELKSNVLNARFKSGYGAIKILEKILEKSKELDIANKPYRLFLYTPLIGHNFLVEYEDFSLKQDFASSNMMWKYNVRLRAVAPLNRSRTEGFDIKSVLNSVSVSLLQRGANSLLNKVKRAI